MENISHELNEAFQELENRYLAAFAAEVEAAREIYRRWPDLITSDEMRPDLAAVLPLAEARGIENGNVMTDPQWRERVREQKYDLAVTIATNRT